MVGLLLDLLRERLFLDGFGMVLGGLVGRLEGLLVVLLLLPRILPLAVILDELPLLMILLLFRRRVALDLGLDRGGERFWLLSGRLLST